MADKFTTDLDRTGTAIGIGTLTQPTTALHRFKCYEAFVGLNGGTPADAFREWKIERMTAVATGTGVTPRALDPASGAATMLALDVITVEGTAGDILFTRSVHERASYTWSFYPGTEIVVAVTNSAGLRVSGASSATVTKANINFEE